MKNYFCHCEKLRCKWNDAAISYTMNSRSLLDHCSCTNMIELEIASQEYMNETSQRQKKHTVVALWKIIVILINRVKIQKK